MASGYDKVRTGAFKGTGANVDVRVVGFRPKMVTVLNEGGLARAEWSETMADGECLKQVTAGTMTKVTTTGITPLSDGFRLGADADLNVAGELVHWLAVG